MDIRMIMHGNNMYYHNLADDLDLEPRQYDMASTESTCI